MASSSYTLLSLRQKTEVRGRGCVGPETLFLRAKGGWLVKAGNRGLGTEVRRSRCRGLRASLTLLGPIVLVLIGRQQVQPLLGRGKRLLEERSSLILGGLSLALAAYLGWQGWTGLDQFQVLS